MTLELTFLAATGFLQFTLLTAHGVFLSLTAGMAWGIGRRDKPIESSDLGRRIERTIINNMESLGVFIPLVITIQIAGFSTALTEASSAIYFSARVAFAVLYLGNIPYVRTIAWLTGQFCLLVLGYAIVTQAI